MSVTDGYSSQGNFKVRKHLFHILTSKFQEEESGELLNVEKSYVGPVQQLTQIVAALSYVEPKFEPGPQC